MLTLLSPAKSLDFDSALPSVASGIVPGQPRLLDRAMDLVSHARALSAADLKRLMGISDALADLNAARFQAFHTPFTPANARPAVYAFNGDVYAGLGADTLAAGAIAFAQRHLRILSGLYGLLRPLDLIQPYRLEMGIALKTPGARTLYAYWGDTITDLIAADLAEAGTPVVVNLASQEYFGAVRPQRLPCPVVTPHFKERRGNQLKVISFNAKRARGAMARAICAAGIDRPDDLKDLAPDGYRFDAALSDAHDWVFVK